MRLTSHAEMLITPLIIFKIIDQAVHELNRTVSTIQKYPPCILKTICCSHLFCWFQKSNFKGGHNGWCRSSSLCLRGVLPFFAWYLLPIFIYRKMLKSCPLVWLTIKQIKTMCSMLCSRCGEPLTLRHWWITTPIIGDVCWVWCSCHSGQPQATHG